MHAYYIYYIQYTHYYIYIHAQAIAFPFLHTARRIGKPYFSVDFWEHEQNKNKHTCERAQRRQMHIETPKHSFHVPLRGISRTTRTRSTTMRMGHYRHYGREKKNKLQGEKCKINSKCVICSLKCVYIVYNIFVTMFSLRFMLVYFEHFCCNCLFFVQEFYPLTTYLLLINY